MDLWLDVATGLRDQAQSASRKSQICPTVTIPPRDITHDPVEQSILGSSVAGALDYRAVTRYARNGIIVRVFKIWER